MIAGLVAAGLLLVAIPSPPVADRGSVSFVGGDLTVPANQVRREVTIYGGSADVEGTVTHDVTVFGGSVQVDGQVGHDLTVFGGSVELGPGADVGHDVTVFGGSLTRDPAARVGHSVNDFDFAGGLAAGALPGLPGFVGAVAGLRVSAALVLLLALLLRFLFPRQIALTRDALDERPFVSLGLGCLTALAGVLLAALLAVTVILLPATAALALVLAAGSVLGLAGVIALIGQRLLAALRLQLGEIPELLIGGLLVVVLVNVPYVGAVFGLLIGSMALGAVVLTRFGTRPHPPSEVPR